MKFRGAGSGKALLERLIAEARDAGYTEMVGGTRCPQGNALWPCKRGWAFERAGAYKHTRGDLHSAQAVT